jgi:hypothetical protein
MTDEATPPMDAFASAAGSLGQLGELEGLVKRATGPVGFTTESDFVAVPDGVRIFHRDDLAARGHPEGRAVTNTINVRSVTSFLDYVEKFASGRSAILVNEDASVFECVINYARPTEPEVESSTPSIVPARGDWKVMLTLEPTQLYSTVKGFVSEGVSLVQIQEFIAVNSRVVANLEDDLSSQTSDADELLQLGAFSLRDQDSQIAFFKDRLASKAALIDLVLNKRPLDIGSIVLLTMPLIKGGVPLSLPLEVVGHDEGLQLAFPFETAWWEIARNLTLDQIKSQISQSLLVIER